MHQEILSKIALLVADGVPRNGVVEAFRREYPSAPIIHVGCDVIHQHDIQSIPLININRIIGCLNEAGANAFSYVGDLGMSRDSRPLRIRGRVPEQEDTDLSTLFNHDRFNIELALNRVAVLFSQAGIRAVHLRETLSSLLVPRGWIVAPRNVLVRQMFEARVQSLINQITLGPLSTPAMARSCFVFDGLKLVTSIEQNTELVLAKAKSVRVSNGEFRCFAKIATDDVEIAIAAPSVGYLTFSACQAASIRLVILDHDHGVFLQKDRSVEYCRKHDIAVFGYARFGEGSGR